MKPFESRVLVILISVLILLHSDKSVAAGIDMLPDEVLSDAEWEQVDQAVERGLAWLATQQQRDGSFPTMPQGQPAVTALCELAFLAHGHLPGDGEYGQQLTRAITYVANCQKDNGLIAFVARAVRRSVARFRTSWERRRPTTMQYLA